MAEPHESPLPGQLLQVVPSIGSYDEETEIHNTERWATTNLDEATVITSLVAGTIDVHKVVLDIDLPAKLLASTTPGHYHLYIDHRISAKRYRKLLKALAKAGLIEKGYLGASLDRGYTAVRLPWVKKEKRA